MNFVIALKRLYEDKAKVWSIKTPQGTVVFYFKGTDEVIDKISDTNLEEREFNIFVASKPICKRAEFLVLSSVTSEYLFPMINWFESHILSNMERIYYYYEARILFAKEEKLYEEGFVADKIEETMGSIFTNLTIPVAQELTKVEVESLPRCILRTKKEEFWSMHLGEKEIRFAVMHNIKRLMVYSEQELTITETKIIEAVRTGVMDLESYHLSMTQSKAGLFYMMHEFPYLHESI